MFSTNQLLTSYVFYLLLFIPFFLSSYEVIGATITLLNKCDYTLWPGSLSNSGSSGFELLPGQSKSIQAGPGWSGRVWARTRCSFDPISGQGSCVTGDCGSGRVECNGSGAKPPATLAEFTIGSGSGTQDYYDVSLVDGYDVPMIIEPSGGSGSCRTTGCTVDLNEKCPNELRVGDGDACKSACEAFGTPEYCCSGAYGSPATCAPTIYPKVFKLSCPYAYSYAYDDATSTFTCTGADYTITFCPASTRKSTKDYQPPYTADQPIISGFGSGVVSGSGSEPETTSGSSTKHRPKFFTGGGQMLPNSSPRISSVIDSKFACQLTFLIFFLCHFN